MFKRKKVIAVANTYDKQWNELQEQKWDATKSMTDLFSQIQYSMTAISCFEEGTPDYDAEEKHLHHLRRKMLCVCGTYDACQADLRMLHKEHHDDLQPQFCIDGGNAPKGSCHEALRRCAKSFKKYG